MAAAARAAHEPAARAGEVRDPAAIEEALAEVTGDLGLATPRVLGAIADHWREVVGDAVAGHSGVRSLRGGVLTIEVDDAPWATELRYLTAELRTRLEALVGPGEVREIRVVVAPRGP